MLAGWKGGSLLAATPMAGPGRNAPPALDEALAEFTHKNRTDNVIRVKVVIKDERARFVRH
jgi:hypothetical protein